MLAANQSLHRAHGILAALADDRAGLGFADLRSRLGGLGAATLSRLLKALQVEGLVDHQGDRYRIGPGLVGLAERILPEARQRRLQTLVDDLAARSGQSALICERVPTAEGPALLRVCTSMTEGGFHYAMAGRTPSPLLCMAFGWPLLLDLDLRERERIIAAHAAEADEDAAANRADLATLETGDGVLVRRESLRGNVQGCTRIVTRLDQTSSIGITVFGHPGRSFTAADLRRWREQVAAVAATQERP